MEEKKELQKIDIERSVVKEIDILKINMDFKSRNDVLKMLLDKYKKELP